MTIRFKTRRTVAAYLSQRETQRNTHLVSISTSGKKIWWRIWRCNKNEASLRTLYVLLLGQVVSFVLAVSGFTSSFIADLGVDAPLTQSFFTYLCLALVNGSILLYRRQRLQVSWYWYLFLGFVDVQGNYLVNKAFQYSSLTSVALLDCWTIPWVIILTWIFLGTRYSIWQFFGAALCVAGLGLVLLSDAGIGGGGATRDNVLNQFLGVTRANNYQSLFIVFPQYQKFTIPENSSGLSGGSRPLLGDTLVIAGTLCIAMSNVGEEFCVKKKDRVELMSMLGLFGLLVSVCEISIVELKSLESIEWSTEIILAFAGFALSNFLFYTLVAFLLKISGAAMFNLSALTSDMWAVVIRIFFYHQKVDWLYYLSFAVVAIGIIIYSNYEKDPTPLPSPEDGSVSAEYQVLNGENMEIQECDTRS